MDWFELGLYFMTGLALLGSPGPGIAAIVAVGRSRGWRGGLIFYGGLQVGLATAAAISATGLFALFFSVPGIETVMAIIATGYLLYLAYTIATAPTDGEIGAKDTASSAFAGLVLGLSNPKAYVVFASLFSSFILVPSSSGADSFSKWAVCVAIIMFVDIVWLYAGVQLGRIRLSEVSERRMNYVLAGAIVIATGIALM